MVMDTATGSLACNRYDVLLPNRPAMSIAVTLEDPTCEALSMWFGWVDRANRCGLVFLSGPVDCPAYPVLWLVRESTLLLVGWHGDRALTDELRQAVAKLLGVFFREVRGLAPELSALQLMIGDESL